MKIEVTILIWRKKCSISWKVIWKRIVQWITVGCGSCWVREKVNLMLVVVLSPVEHLQAHAIWSFSFFIFPAFYAGPAGAWTNQFGGACLITTWPPPSTRPLVSFSKQGGWPLPCLITSWPVVNDHLQAHAPCFLTISAHFLSNHNLLTSSLQGTSKFLCARHTIANHMLSPRLSGKYLVCISKHKTEWKKLLFS